MAIHPEDESKNILFLTIPLADIHESTLGFNLEPQRLSFSATAGRADADQKEYAFTIDLYDEVIPEQSRRTLSTRSFSLVLRKKKKQLEYWPRLTKDKARSPYIKVDFNKWVDQDEQDKAVDLNSDFTNDYEHLGADGKAWDGIGIGDDSE